MKTRPVIPREQANRDVDEAIAFYLDEAGTQAASGFIDALERPTPTLAAIPARAHHVTPTNSIYQACVSGP